ncbi:MAG TPA: histidinol dehydrogenase [Acidimicrobiales bacterium]|nr:histidinol dehydrogenase [Acidimicrobiales bacterium]
MALARLDLRGHRGPFDAVVPRPAAAGADVREAVAAVIGDVRRRGDDALRELTERFDGVAVTELRVPPEEVASAPSRVPAALREALGVAHERIRAYHAHTARDEPAGTFCSDGVEVRELVRPVARAGCYAPGGRARYPSTVLMCATPAAVAGVREVALCAPPGPDGRVADAVLAAAALAGVDEVYRIGGAQAIAALAYGTESVRRVDVVVGPGNLYVAEAKRQVAGAVGVASAFAGPSEVVVVAGPGTPARLAAIDLVVQAEHGPDGLAWLVTWSEATAREVADEVAALVAASPREADLRATLAKGGYACLVDGPEAAVAVANVIAPEHLELLVPEAADLLPLVEAAGAVFLGLGSPASFGDYLAGPNHVLPTDRTARFASALGVEDFRHRLHAVAVDPRALAALGPHVVTLAEAEGLPAHAESIRARL